MLSFEHLLNYLTAVRIQGEINVAIPASSLCITRLYKIASMKPIMEKSAEKRREVMIDLLIGLGIPILEMISRESVQPFTLN